VKVFNVEIKETYRCIAEVLAETEEQAIKITKELYEDGVIEIDSEDISATEYTIVR